MLSFGQQTVIYDFENGNITDWTQKPLNRWEITTSIPLWGTASLKHTFDNSTAYTDTIYTHLPSWDINKGDVTWRFLLRHGYSPSSSNSWWVYLMADANLATYGESGYAVGVNLTGSDDLLKIWIIDNGSPQVALSSTLNWETQVGSSRAAAVEVTRSAKGVFTLKASAAGNFDALTTYGDFTDSTYKNFSYFGIGYRYSSAQDMKLWIDNISFVYQPLNPNDRTTQVLQPNFQVPPSDIPSTATSKETSVDVLKFNIADNGTADGLPTYVKTLTIKNPYSDNTAWSNLLDGITLKEGGQVIPIKTLAIIDQQIIVGLDSFNLTVPDAQSVEVTLGIFLKSNSIPDNINLYFEIENQNHGFVSSLSGSGFSKTFPSKVQSGPFTIRVSSTKTQFRSVSSTVISGKPFSVEVAAIDTNGNIDNDYTGQMTLSLAEGSGLLSSVEGLTQTANQGITRWDSLIYNHLETIKLQVSAIGIEGALSEDIVIGFDTTTFASVPETQVASFDISSMTTAPAKSSEIMRFRITDAGSDGAPTYVKKIHLNRANATNPASLSKTIEGVLVKRGTDYIATSSIDINTTTLDIYLPMGAITTPDGQTTEISIFIYLKNKDIGDNQTLQLYIDKTYPQFESYDNGSRFTQTFPTNINSAAANIRVNATQLSFTLIPDQVGVNEPFTVKLKPTDTNGNSDIDYSGSVELMLGAGNGELTVETNNPSPIVSGEVQFEAKYTVPGSFTLVARCPELNDAISPAITCADAEGVALPLTHPTDSVIFTPANSYKAAALEVIRFKLRDGGSTDGLPLIVKRIKLLAFNPSTLPVLARLVQGFVIENGTESITPSSFSFSEGILQIDFNDGDLMVNNDDSVNIIVKSFLWDRGLVDGYQFQFYIPSVHDWTTHNNSTAFYGSFPSTIFGRPCRVNVEADRLLFETTPHSVNPNQPFSISVKASDSRGNVDSEFQAYAALEKLIGPGNLQIDSMLKPLDDGLAQWDNLQLSAVGVYQLKSYFGWLANAISEPIYCGYGSTCWVDEDFEAQLPEWIGINNWVASRALPLGGEFSLVHAGDPADKVSVLGIPVNVDLNGKAAEWRIRIRNGNWEPSSENYFYLAFISNTDNPLDPEAEGYAVGLNPSAGNDLISIFQFSGGKKSKIISSSYEWNENEEIILNITLSPSGTIKLWFTPTATGLKTFGGEAKLNLLSSFSYISFIYGYTSSRAGQLWIDDIQFCTTNFPPVIQSTRVLNLNTIRVNFSKDVELSTALDIQNYLLKFHNSVNIDIKEIKPNTNQSVTLVTEKLPFEKLTLYVDNITDSSGYSLPDSIEFGFSAEGNLGRLIINEIMANPTPSNGLPEYEYIELFNPNSDTILTEGWTLWLNEKQVSLPPDTIAPQSYVLIGGTTAMSAFNPYGKTIEVSSFPALLNNGMLLKLYDADNNLIAFADYNNDWYNDPMRSSGGYSLECIDFRNLAEGRNNWQACMANEGGTPCAPNSVLASKPDVVHPYLLYHQVPDSTTINLVFNEPMDILTVTLSENYSTNLIIDEIVTDDLFHSVTIKLSNPIQQGNVYDILIQNVGDFSGNLMPDTLIRIGLPVIASPNDIVINEILFNPHTGGTDFVELYNRSSKTIDLKHLRLANRDEKNLEIKDTYAASATPRLIFPGEYAVTTLSPPEVMQFYTCLNPKFFVPVPQIPAYNNDMGIVVLLNNSNEVIDEVRYTEKMHNRLLSNVIGVSLERINPDLPSNQPATWHSAAQAAGFATPTYRNSQYTEYQEAKCHFTLTPETFSPDGDGRDDYLLISYQLPNPGFVANIRIFNAIGIEIFRLANNLTLGTSGQLSWDGINSYNHRVDAGIYIILIEYYNLNGKVEREKKTCVVGYRN